jgi:ferredoxin
MFGLHGMDQAINAVLRDAVAQSCPSGVDADELISALRNVIVRHIGDLKAIHSFYGGLSDIFGQGGSPEGVEVNRDRVAMPVAALWRLAHQCALTSSNPLVTCASLGRLFYPMEHAVAFLPSLACSNDTVEVRGDAVVYKGKSYGGVKWLTRPPAAPAAQPPAYATPAWYALKLPDVPGESGCQGCEGGCPVCAQWTGEGDQCHPSEAPLPPPETQDGGSDGIPLKFVRIDNKAIRGKVQLSDGSTFINPQAAAPHDGTRCLLFRHFLEGLVRLTIARSPRRKDYAACFQELLEEQILPRAVCEPEELDFRVALFDDPQETPRLQERCQQCQGCLVGLYLIFCSKSGRKPSKTGKVPTSLSQPAGVVADTSDHAMTVRELLKCMQALQIAGQHSTCSATDALLMIMRALYKDEYREADENAVLYFNLDTEIVFTEFVEVRVRGDPSWAELFVKINII